MTDSALGRRLHRSAKSVSRRRRRCGIPQCRRRECARPTMN